MYGSTQAEFCKLTKRTYTTNWRAHQTNILKSIIDDYPDYFLDEIQAQMYESGGGWWSPTTIWRKLRNKLGYSLQVATDKSFVANEEDQRQYQQALEDHVINVNQLIYIDESEKDRNSSRRRLLWSKKGQTPYRPSYLISVDGKRYLLLAACDLDGFVTEACETVL